MAQTATTPYNPSTNTILGPLQVSTCSVWLDGQDRNSMIFSGNNVTTWKDKSGSGNDATSTGNISNIPSINGFNAMAYPGVTNTFFRGPMVNTTSDSVTGFAVINMLATSFASIRVISLGITTAVDFNNNLYTALIERGGSGLNSYRNNSPKSTASYTFGTPALVCSIYDGASNNFYINGTAGTPVASTGNFGYSNYEIGSEFGEDTVGSVHYDGYIGEIILFNKIALNTIQRQQVEGYLAWKWNLQASLPTTHPYYNNAYLPNSYPISYFPPRMTPTSVVPTVPGFTIPTTIRQYVFNPRSITGAALWLDGADPLNNGIQPNSGTVISTWSDKSGNGRNATVASARVAGTFNTAFKCVYFQASNVGYVTTYAANPTNETMFIVANIDSPANVNNNTIIGGQLGARSFGFGYSGAPSSGIGFSSYLNNEVAWPNTSIVGPSAGTTALITGTVSNTTNLTVALNGATSRAGTISAWTAGTTTYLGVDTTTTIYYYKGYVMEILFYNSVLLISQRQQIEGYLAWKWNLQKSLPSSHPFFNFPPG